jgi:hypothetical protein
MFCDFKPTVTTKALLAAVMPQPAVLGFRVILASLPDTVKLAISEAFKTFADTGALKSATPGAPHGITKSDKIFPIHAILFFPFFS